MVELKIILTISVILVSALFINQAFAIPFTSLTDEWQLREQPVDAVTTIDCKYGFSGGGGLTNFPNPPTPAKASRGFCHVFKVFDKADITEKVLSVTWSTNRGGDPSGTLGAICVLDGAFDRNNATQFPSNNNSVGACGGNTAVTLHLVNPSSEFGTQTDTITLLVNPLITPDPNKDQVTIFVMVKDPSSSRRYSMNLKEINFLEFVKWDWLDPSRTVTMATTTTNNDTGITNPKISSLDVVAPAITLTGGNIQAVNINTSYVEQGATALDAQEGDVTGNIIIDASTVDTSIAQGYTVTYTVSDSSGNERIAERLVIIKREPTANRTDEGREIGGTLEQIPQSSDIPTLSLVPEEPKTIDEVFDLFAQLNQLFAPTEPVETIVQTTPQPQTQVPTSPQITDRGQSLFESIQNFFMNLFG